MRKIVIGMIVALCAIGAVADSYTYTYTSLGNSTNTSDALPVSGWLDKIECSGLGATTTNTITIATYDGTTAVETIGNVTLTTAKIVRLRKLPTDNTGTDLAAVLGASITNYSSVVSLDYERIMLGGNLKIRTVNVHANSNDVKVVFYYEPLKR